MGRAQGWTQISASVTVADHARLQALTDCRYPSEYIREALNEWLESQGQPCLESGVGRGTHMKKKAEAS